MSKLDGLRTAAHQISGDADPLITALGQLGTDDAVQDALAIGIESGA